MMDIPMQIPTASENTDWLEKALRSYTCSLRTLLIVYLVHSIAVVVDAVAVVVANASAVAAFVLLCFCFTFALLCYVLPGVVLLFRTSY